MLPYEREHGWSWKIFSFIKIHTKEKNAKAKSYRNEPIVG